MKRAIAFGLVLVLAATCVICVAQSSKEANRPKTADDVLKSYSQRVYTELLPRAGELSDKDAIEAASAIAAEVLVPHKDLLFDKAKAELAKLPTLKADDLDKTWEPAFKVEEVDVVINAFAGALGHSTSQPSTKPVKQSAALLAHLWNPQAAASYVRNQVLVMRFAFKEVAGRAKIGALASPSVYAVSADPQRPIIAIQTGPELFVVSLDRTDEGYYVDTKIQWLKKKGAASQPATAASQD